MNWPFHRKYPKNVLVVDCNRNKIGTPSPSQQGDWLWCVYPGDDLPSVNLVSTWRWFRKERKSIPCALYKLMVMHSHEWVELHDLDTIFSCDVYLHGVLNLQVIPFIIPYAFDAQIQVPCIEFCGAFLWESIAYLKITLLNYPLGPDGYACTLPNDNVIYTSISEHLPCLWKRTKTHV